MNIAQITPYYFPTTKWLGPVSIVHEISRYLLKKEYTVSIITSFPTEPFQPYEVLPKIKIFRYHKLKGLQTYFISPLLFFHFFRRQKYDIIHIHNYRNFFSDIGAFYAKIRKTPLILTPHGTLERNGAQRRGFASSQQIFDIYDKLTFCFAAKAAQWILFSSRQEKKYSNDYRTNNMVIPFGIDVNRFRKPIMKKSFHKKMDIEDDEFILLSVGRISREKNTLLLLKALKILKKTGYENITVVLVGELVSAIGGSKKNDYLTTIREFASKYGLLNKIKFVGGVYGEDLINIYLSSNIYVCVSLAENFCIPILEAAASRLPIVSTKVGIAPDFIDNMKSGVLLKNYTPTNLANEIRYLIDNKEVAEEIGKRAYLKAKKKYSWNKVGQEIEKIYLTALRDNI